MVDLHITLVSTDGIKKESVTCAFTTEEWQTIQSFHSEVEKLRATTFVKKGMGGEVSISLYANGRVNSKSKITEEDAFYVLLHKLRPFLLDGESLNFYRVKKVFDRRLHNHMAFKNHLKVCKDRFELKHLQYLEFLGGLGGPPLSVKQVMHWLNAFEYHRDKDKQPIAQKELGIFGKDQNGQPVVRFVLTEMVQAILQLGDFAETLIAVANGSPEIKCPPNWFE